MSPGQVSRKRPRRLHPLSWLHAHRPVAKSSLHRLLAAPVATAVTVFVIAVALLLPALLLGLSSNLSSLLADYGDSARISLYLDEATSDTEAIQVSNDLLTDEAIESVRYVAPDEALIEFGDASGLRDVLLQLDRNPLPPAILVQPLDSSPPAVEALADRLAQRPQVNSLQVDSLWLQRLAALNDLITLLGRLLGVIVFAGLFFIVGNTIKLAIANRQQEIQVIKLVGGSDSYIARPFLYTGLYYGAAGGFLAYILQLIVFYIINAQLQTLFGLYQNQFELQGFGLGSALALIFSGAVIGWGSALLASLRQIRAFDP